MAFRIFRTLNRNQQKFFLISCGLFILGFSVMGFLGLPILWQIYQSDINPQCYKEKSCNSYGFSYSLRDNKGNLESVITGGLDFETHSIFSESNPIDYKIVFGADNIKHIKSIFLLVDTDKKINFSTLDNMSFDVIKSSLNTHVKQIFPNSIPLIPTITLYHISGNWFNNDNQTVFFETGNVTLAVLVVDDKNMTHLSSEYGPVFKLQHFENKIQADQNIQDRNSNKQILALTWMGVALAPILIASDFMGRIFLD